MSLDVPAKFPGEELKKSLDNLQNILDSAKPLALQLVPDEKVKETIGKCVDAIQALLCEAQEYDQRWEEEKERIGWSRLNESQQRQARIQHLSGKKERSTITPKEETELGNLEKQEGMR